MSLEAVAFPGRRSVPESPRSWADSRRLVWDTVGELRRKNAKADELRIGQLLAERMEGDNDLLEAGAFLLAYNALAGERVHRQRSVTAPTPRQRVERQAAETKKVTTLAAKVRETVFLDMPVRLLDGTMKPLRFCLGSEIEALGDAYSRIAEKVGPTNMTGEILTEREVRELLCATPT